VLGTVCSKITYDDAKYNGAVCVLPSYLSKGLDFDAVIISDKFPRKNIIHNH